MDDVRDVWESVAPAWEQNRELVYSMSRDASARMIDQLDPKPGRSVLELASGPGETGFEIARRIAPGILVQSDIAESMVAAAERGAMARGLDNIEHRVLDAQAMDVADDSFDGVACRYGFMLMPDQGAAFRECARVLRPGGRLVFAVWGPPERNIWILAVALPLVQAGKAPPGDPTAPGGIFSLASEDRVRELLEDAGFTDVEVEEVVASNAIDDFDAWWEIQTEIAGPLAATFEALSADERAAMRDGSRQILEPMREGSTYRITSGSLVVSATAPR